MTVSPHVWSKNSSIIHREGHINDVHISVTAGQSPAAPVSAPVDESEYEKLREEYVSTVSGYGEQLMEVVCRDACDGHEVVRVSSSASFLVLILGIIYLGFDFDHFALEFLDLDYFDYELLILSNCFWLPNLD